MEKLNIKKTIGAFIITVSVLLLVLSIVDLFNKVDYVSEYKLCTDISLTDTELSTCKENATTGLGFKIRENQLDISISQYMIIYLTALIKILISITLLVIGEAIYKTKTEKKEIVTIKKPIKKKKK